jgi:glucose/arabinose dehydrogenase
MRYRTLSPLVAVPLLVLALWLHGCNGSEEDSAPAAGPPAGVTTEPPPVVTDVTLRLVPVVTGLASPTHITHAGDDRLFIVEQPGRIRIVQQGTLLAPPFLDITSLVQFGGEQGLLSVAFHPDYRSAGMPGFGLFWVNYTNRQGHTVIARYTVSRDSPQRADPDSALTILFIEQPFANHNGGLLAFGPVEGPARQRYLYIGMGDGGGAGDPRNHAQRDDTLLGKMLRLDPSLEATPAPPFYSIPPDNPRAAAGPPLGLIWAKGLRNPWRFAFDALLGDLYIADVGQNRWEEVHVTPAGAPSGLNYGWRLMEGEACFDPPTNCAAPGLERPVVVYANGDGRCAVIGGHVYRGTHLPALAGTYLYADLCSGEIFGLVQVTPGVWDSSLLLNADLSPLTFGQDVRHEVYLGSTDGTVYQLVAGP